MRKIATLSLALLFCFIAAPQASAQTVTVNNLKVTNMLVPGGGRSTPVTVTGQGINLSGTHNVTLAPRACTPCQRGGLENPRINRIISLTSVNAVSGEIDGGNYEQVYLAGELSVQAASPAQIPLSWAKRIRLSVPVTLTGTVAAYKNFGDIGNPQLAVFHFDDIEMQGRATVMLTWILGSSQRQQFTDVFFEYDLTQVE